MKMKWIGLLAAVLLLALALFLVVRLAAYVVGGLNRAGDMVVETWELAPAAPTPDADIYGDQYYDEPEPEPLEDEPRPTPTPEAMVTVPVIETPEDLARDEAA